MRKSVFIALSAVAALGLSACSENTQDAAEQTAESAGNDIERAADAADNAVEEGAAKVGSAVETAGDKAAAAAKNVGNAAEQERAKAEADIQDESVEEAKRD